MHTATLLTSYFTVVIPPVGPKHATQWHAPTTVTRGAFSTEDGAIEWAKKNLEGAPYSTKEISTL
jgi:hypothetical protein